jgi:hypothetical protein
VVLGCSLDGETIAIDEAQPAEQAVQGLAALLTADPMNHQQRWHQLKAALS